MTAQTIPELAARLRCSTCSRQAVFEASGLKCPLHPRAALVWLAECEPIPRPRPAYEQEELFK